MQLDLSQFFKPNVVDTCAVWHILSSVRLYKAAVNAGCSFCVTQFVVYECLHKPRSASTPAALELQERFRTELGQTRSESYQLEIADLQDVELLEQRKRLGMGELSSIAFAKKTRQAFFTDDQGARKLAKEVLVSGHVQTTPHLLGWLFFTRGLIDAEFSDVLMEHERFDGKLRKYFDEVYNAALQFRLTAHTPPVA